MEHTNTFLEKEPVSKLMRMYSVPCIISLLVAALYNIVDQIFIANASYLGSYGNAANTVVFPLTIVALAIAVMIGDGACAYVSILLGMKKNDEASGTVGNAVLLTIVSGLVITALYLGFSKGILTVFGGTVNEETYRQAKEYFFWITAGIPITGYNIGADRKDRAKELFTLLLKAEAIVGFTALLIVELIPGKLIAIFGAANESVYYTEFAVRSFRIYLCMMVFATVNKGTFIYLQSLGKALASTVISMIREVVFGVGFALLLPILFGLDGVLYSMPVSDALTFVIAAFVIRQTVRELSE